MVAMETHHVSITCCSRSQTNFLWASVEMAVAVAIASRLSPWILRSVAASSPLMNFRVARRNAGDAAYFKEDPVVAGKQSHETIVRSLLILQRLLTMI